MYGLMKRQLGIEQRRKYNTGLQRKLFRCLRTVSVEQTKSNVRQFDNFAIHNSQKRKKKASGVLKEQYITVGVKHNGRVTERLKLRRITFKTEEGKVYMFITNNFTLPASQVATIYKSRWMIELLFKQIKQNFPLRYFWGDSVNAVKMQVYCVLIAQLLMVVLRKKAATKKNRLPI